MWKDLARALCPFLFIGLISSCSSDMNEKEKRQERADIQKNVNATLKKLYAVQPQARKAISNASGYAVFNNFGTKIFFAGGGAGEGIAKARGQKNIYMKMVEAQAGLGMGISKFSVIFVFDKLSAFNEFVTQGWQGGAQANVAAKDGEKGVELAGAVSVSPGVWMYQLTDAGLSASITVKGTKYYRNDDLN